MLSLSTETNKHGANPVQSGTFTILEEASGASSITLEALGKYDEIHIIGKGHGTSSIAAKIDNVTWVGSYGHIASSSASETAINYISTLPFGLYTSAFKVVVRKDGYAYGTYNRDSVHVGTMSASTMGKISFANITISSLNISGTLKVMGVVYA